MQKKLLLILAMLLIAIGNAMSQNYLTFTAQQDGSTLGINHYYNNPDIKYSLNGGDWTNLTTTLTLKEGDVVRVKGNNPEGFSKNISPGQYSSFTITGKVAASGSVMSLIDGIGTTKVIPNQYCLTFLFYKCTSLTQAPELPATQLADHCYHNMFSGCTSLTKAPELPATQLASSCYSSMFADCTSLTQAPKLPATQLASICYQRMFFDCTSLTQAPELPATQLASYCYELMFHGCTSLTQAPKLPATQLADKCYEYMFAFCKNLTQAPELPATQLAESCYSSMFGACTNLTKAPELPATQLASECYSDMFGDCTSLTQAPELPATQLADKCYFLMFKGCTGLNQAPELPATQLASGCYQNMFTKCTSLTQAPELPATQLATSCYKSMFQGCSKLNYIKVGFTDWTVASDATKNWVDGVSKTGTFECPEELAIEYGSSRIPYDNDNQWNVEHPNNYLTFTAEENGSTLGINHYRNSPDIKYSLNGGAWTDLKTTLTLKEGDVVRVKGNNPEGFNQPAQYSNFTITGKVAASGSVMSLIDGIGTSKVIPNQFCFYRLFEGCSGLTQAPELPAMRLAYECYHNMFEGCSGLTQAPELPATQLAYECYYNMFSGCTSLTKAPELPATQLASGCYSFMFSNCTSLTKAPKLPATQLADWCYSFMFSGCTSLTKATELPATQLADNCYYFMFRYCINLTQAPELPATQLTKECYRNMFYGCSKLNYIKVGFSDWTSASDATTNWVNGVSKTGTFECPEGLAVEYGSDRIPYNETYRWNSHKIEADNNCKDFIVWNPKQNNYIKGEKVNVSCSQGYVLKTLSINGNHVTFTDGEYVLTMPNEDVTLSATKEAIEYKISYVLNGGTNYESNPKSYTIESKDISLVSPTKTGYDFVKWTPSNKIAKGSTGDKEFTASWKAVVYAVNCGDNVIANVNSSTFDKPVVELTAKDRTDEGYKFENFTIDGEVVSSPISIKDFAKDITIEAVYSKIDYTVDLGGDKNITADKSTANVGDEVTITVASKDGYDSHLTINGKEVDLDENGKHTFIMPAGNVDIKASYSIITYSISYVLNGGTNDESNPKSYTIESKDISLVNPTKRGYTFDKWTPEGSIPAGSFGDKEFAASWEAVVYDIVVTSNNVTADKSAVTFEDDVVNFAHEDRSGEGLEFVEYMVNGNAIEGSAISIKDFADNITVEAVYDYINYDISCDEFVTPDRQTARIVDVVNFEVADRNGELKSLVRVLANGEEVSTGHSFSVDMKDFNSDITFTTEWENIYLVKADGNVTGLSTDRGIKGTEVLFGVTQHSGKTPIVKLNGKVVDSDGSYSFVIDDRDIEITVEYQQLEASKIEVSAISYCADDDMVITFATDNLASEYKITFSDEAKAAGFGDTEFEAVDQSAEAQSCSVAIPKGAEYGDYKAFITVRNKFGVESEPSEFDIKIGYPRDIIKTKYYDVIYVSNSEGEFKGYQWFKDDAPIAGATKQYYSAYYDDPEHLLYGTFAVMVTRQDGSQFKTCPVTIEKPALRKAIVRAVKVYPNPAAANEVIRIELENFSFGDIEESTIMIYNSNGSQVMRISAVEQTNEISLPAGKYTGVVITNGSKLSFKIIVQ